MKNNYYIVKAVCGHVGKGKAVDKDFAVIAHSGKEAASKARLIPRVKHDFKYAIKSVVNVDYEAYALQLSMNDLDPYLKCENKRDQNRSCNALSIYRLHDEEEKATGKKISKRAYVNNYCFHDDFDWEY